MESIQVRLTYHPAYLSGQMEIEVRRVDYPKDREEAINGHYNELDDGEILMKELPVAASLRAADIEEGKAATAVELRRIGLQLQEGPWYTEGEYALYNDTKPVSAPPAPLTYDIFEGMTGRGLASYDLLDEAMTAHGLTKRDAHDAITALLQDLIADEPDLILNRRPVRTVTAPGIDNDHWLTVSEETATHIREALAATYEN